MSNHTTHPAPSASAALPTPAHEHLIRAHESLDDTATALNAARRELAKLRDRAQALTLNEGTLRALVIAFAEAKTEMRDYLREHDDVCSEGADPEVQKGWSELVRRVSDVEHELVTLGLELRDESAARAA